MFEKFTYLLTDGYWILDNQTATVVVEDVPQISVNNTITIDWNATNPFTFLKGHLAFSDKNQGPDKLSYIILRSPLVGQLQGVSTVYNASYCTSNFQPANCTPPVDPCRYIFTQQSLDGSGVTLGSSLKGPGYDSFEYNITDGYNIDGPHLRSSQISTLHLKFTLTTHRRYTGTRSVN